MNEKEFAEVVEIVCREPNFVTMNGTFPEVVAYLEGYSKRALDVEPHLHLTPFFQWLAKKFNLDATIMGNHEFRQMFTSDEEAIKNLSALYLEYAESL